MSLSSYKYILKLGWWMVKMTVLFYLASLLRTWMIVLAVWESRPDVGSSKIKTDGFVTIYTAIQTLFFSPPEIPFLNFPPIYVSAHFLN